MARANVDLIVPHIGLTNGGTTGPGGAMTLDEAVTATQDLIEAARAVKPDVIALAHGGQWKILKTLLTFWSAPMPKVSSGPRALSGCRSRPLLSAL